MPLRTHRTWLLVTAIVVGSFGPVFALGAFEPTAAPARWTLELLSGPGDQHRAYDAATTRFLSALTGGFLLGWGVMIGCLRAWVFDVAPEAVRRTVLAGLLAWFVLDSAGSIASGTPWNAGFNVGVLLLAAGPLWWRVEGEERADVDSRPARRSG
jgi:hypothetical protein